MEKNQDYVFTENFVYENLMPWEQMLHQVAASFNQKFAEYWNNYVDKLVALTEQDKENMISSIFHLNNDNNKILSEIKSRKDKNKILYQEYKEAKAKYTKSSMPKKLVESYRKYSDSESDEHLKGAIDYLDKLDFREKCFEKMSLVLKKYESEKEDFVNYFSENNGKIKYNNQQIKILSRYLQTNFLNSDVLAEDKKEVYDLICSKKSVFAFMVLCRKILNKYSGTRFSYMSSFDKERVMEIFGNRMMDTGYNFDFVSCVYEKQENNGKFEKILNRMKDDKFVFRMYSGIWLTIKGHLLKSFMQVINESNLLISVNQHSNSDDNGGEIGYDSVTSTEKEYACGGRKILRKYIVNNNAKKTWAESFQYMNSRKKQMSNDLKKMLESSSNYFSNVVESNYFLNVINFVLSGINKEISGGRIVGSQMNRLAEDALGGVGKNKKFEIDSVVLIIKTYMCKSFLKDIKNVNTLEYCKKDGVDNMIEKISEETKKKCEQMVSDMEKEANSFEEKVDFLSGDKEKPMTDLPKSNQIYVRK